MNGSDDRSRCRSRVTPEFGQTETRVLHIYTTDGKDTESALHSSTILGLQIRSVASFLGYNPESCKIYSKLRIIQLFCSSKEREQSVLFTKTIGKRHAFNDGGAVVGVQLKLSFGIRRAIQENERSHTP